jgi:hypothetical protein
MNTRMDSMDKKMIIIKEGYFGQENLKGINDDSHTLQSQLYSALYGISEYENGENSADLIANCRMNVDKTISEINKFINEDYAAFKAQVSATSFNYFKKE